ncbi:TPA: DUF4400 domain-containing protein [Burkholderia vietnamiensis]|uniref:DUF4400 domain-containing protein n=1 Tax=Burkholderia vietnamiensis TaxID=60552 RepID=A0AA45BFM6_BURVI|nr:DUF4400 domain-containing protein [Burkholderia vietnamiensis]AOK42531.1 hypothetical protein WL96_15345 [Burkholderia vietnamiensis]KVE17625.1 hypothetical protein WI92_04660 [Burkholderia vietnamiensis]KVR82510.1 hypothetical protein WK26_11240 [Burkholderia vietnamiensis]KVR90005.1 hypothetical protein WK28_23425 [Burkholderia vietnamiensis]KVS11229.1 hypothetical protein WK29_18970 [Burkholderia vietnamiensis]
MAGSRFVRHAKVWFFFVPLIGGIILPAIPDPALFTIPDAEASSVTAIVGEDRADAAIESTNRSFRRYFVESGLVRTTVSETREGTLNDGGVSNFAHTWVQNFWRMVYRAVYRATVMKLWLLGTIVFGVAMFVDGVVRRKIRAAAAGYASPVSFHLAAHGLLTVFGAAATVLILPVPVLAPYWIVAAATIGVLLWNAASSYR